MPPVHLLYIALYCCSYICLPCLCLCSINTVPFWPLQTYNIRLKASERTNEVAGQYAKAVREVATRLGAACLDLHSLLQQVHSMECPGVGAGLKCGAAPVLQGYLVQQAKSARWVLVPAAQRQCSLAHAHSQVLVSALAD